MDAEVPHRKMQTFCVLLYLQDSILYSVQPCSAALRAFPVFRSIFLAEVNEYAVPVDFFHPQSTPP